MNFFKKSRVSFTLFSKMAKTLRQYDELSREGYEKNVIVYRCVSLIAKSMSSVPLLVYKNAHEVESHPLKNLLDRPNPYMNYQSFMENLVATYLLSGNAYIFAVPDQSLYVLCPNRVHMCLSEKGYPVAYDYVVDSQKQRLGLALEKGKASVLHIKSFHPRFDWYGFGAVEAAAFAIDQHNAVAEHNLSLLKNGGRPSGALIVQGADLSDMQRKQLHADLEKFYEGSSNAGRMMLLEGNFKWQELGLSPKDLDFLPGKDVSAREIACAFGVCPILVGLVQDASYNNYKEARLQLWEDTVIPLLKHFLGYLNNWFAPFYDVRLDFDLDGIPALASKRQETWAKLNDCQFLTINEKRQAVGYSPIQDGDSL